MAISKPANIKVSSSIKSFKNKLPSLNSIKTPKSFAKLASIGKFTKVKIPKTPKRAVLKKAIKNVGF